MAKNTSVALGDHYVDFIEDQVASGRFGSASEVVRAGLRLLEDTETRMAELRAALTQGEKSGPAEDFDFDAFLKERRARTAKLRKRGPRTAKPTRAKRTRG
jgi:antitoxin ParD1/3/4